MNDQERIERLKERQTGIGVQGTSFASKYDGKCAVCNAFFDVGDPIIKLSKPVRRDLPALHPRQQQLYYVVLKYAHETCPAGSCLIHGKSVYWQERECPLCGRDLVF